MRNIVIVGAGAAGLAAAETLRREGYDGTLTLVGQEPSLPYDRPPLSKQILAGQWEPERITLRAPDSFAALDLDWRPGRPATQLDTVNKGVILADATQVPYDGLVIATGVRARPLPGTGAHVLRTLDDALALRRCLAPGRRLVIVGAGFLGSEAAAVARSLGCEVTLLEPTPVPLAHAVGPEVGQLLAQAHFDHGVDVRTGVTVTETRPDGVYLAGGELVPADAVLVAIGSTPNTQWLIGSGLDVHDGVACDRYGEAAPTVYAAGDVAHWYNPLFDASMRIEHRTSAAEQGMTVARNLMRPESRKPFPSVPYFWSHQYDLRIQAYGHLRGHSEMAIVEGNLTERRFVAAYRKDDRVVGALAIGMPPKVIRQWRQAIADRATWQDAVLSTTVTTKG
ncbi:NAD(P)/FAD-dependent oxidoreductase [Streptomyces shenzhenensis]|uniref:FAD-dependent oxidoreductase n=1 Tax=Streptomyces shenzhenensis TaxID=943815 RepID=A0A3M0IG16_9ACTN|nr:FAD-dependent oxidoreductase [Streptomyces shenzhenensis]RMB87030.1 FAD-dependent oxidoreductase [Streptomyces shenzhenensis]